MKKYISSLLTNEIAVLVMLLSINSLNHIPEMSLHYAIYFVTFATLLKSLAKNYILYFKRDDLKNVINSHIKKNSIKNYSLNYKIFSLLSVFVPLILNTVFTFIYLNSLTISIIWGILLLDGINYYCFVRKTKKDFLGEKNV